MKILPLKIVARAFHVAAFVACLAGSARIGSAQTIRQDLWVTNGTVSDVVPSGSTIYIGGYFTYVGPPTGSAAPLDAVTGAALGIPRINGGVYAIAPDGSGGWYIGGHFTSVGGLARSNIAHISADHTVSPGTRTRAAA
jgi:hypothetical protein